MKLAALLICLLSAMANVIEAVPTKKNNQTIASHQIAKWQNQTIASHQIAKWQNQTIASHQIAKWQQQYNNYIEATVKTRKSGCTSDNIVYRQEWGSLSKQCRIDYINAVKCLQQKPALYPKSDVPGARSHFDDFTASHIINAPHVHFSGLFLHFHRYFIWLYEKALQEQCGYKGTQPYWDWTLSWQDPRNSTVFDGSPTSLGSNGKPTPHGPIHLTAFGLSLEIAPGTGGGCVYSGPFTNSTLNLGPVAFAPIGGDNGLDYNPRCLSRDLSLAWSNQTKPTDVTKLISSCNDIACFDTALEAVDGANAGIHTAGHNIIGGVGIDPYASPGDPVFYLHHAQVDRVWTIWQNLNARNRTSQVYGTSTALNVPPSPNVTLNTEIDFGILSPQQPMGNLVSSIDGPFCYMYI